MVSKNTKYKPKLTRPHLYDKKRGIGREVWVALVRIRYPNAIIRQDKDNKEDYVAELYSGENVGTYTDFKGGSVKPVKPVKASQS